ncbi:MAG: MMPL family transporter [Pseudomonadota bacterium]
MKNIISIVARHPWLILIVTAAITLAALKQIPHLQVEITAEGMMVNDPQVMAEYHQTLDTFGSENITVIYLEDPDLFEPENLTAIQQGLRAVEAIPQVSRTASLFSVRYLRTVDGYVYTDPYLARIPATREAAHSVIQAAHANPLVENNLLSSDGSVMGINVYLDMNGYQRGFDEQVSAALDEAIAPLQQRFRTVFQFGNPAIRTAISQQIRSDQKLIMPLALLVLVATLGLTLRRLHAALIPLFTAGLSVIWILGLMAVFGVPVNLMTSIVPALLIIVGSTEDIHLLSEHQAGIRKGLQGHGAIGFMADNMGTAVALTFVTTFLGFISISLNRIDLLMQFGLVTAAGLLLNFLITISLVPVSLQLTRRLAVTTRRLGGYSFERLVSQLHGFIFRFPRQIIAIVLALMLICFYWATKIQVNNNVMDYFEPSSRLPVQADLLHRNLSGIQALSIVVQGMEGTFLQVPFLQELHNLQEYLTETGLFDKSFSFADFIGVVHGGIDAEQPEGSYLPARSEVVKEYMSLLDHENAKSFISADYSQARIIVRHGIDSSSQLNEAVDGIRAYTGQWLDPGLSVTVTGASYLNSQAVDTMAKGQALSLLLMLVTIFLLVSFLFMNMKAGMVAVVANLFPIVVLFGVMGLLGLTLDTGTSMVGAIALGICVDHTMHFMVRYQRLAHSGISEMHAIKQVVRQESVPIIATALALALGFATLIFSDFLPVARFGMLSALVMLLALAGTFIVIPLMLRNIRLITVWDLLSIRLRDEVLKECKLFRDMQPWQIRKLVVMSQVEQYTSDEAILLRGSESDAMMVILEGSAEVWRTRSDGSTFQTGIYQPGDVFGVTSLVAKNTQLADIVAAESVRLLIFRWESIHAVANVYPRISSRLYKNLSLILGNRVINHNAEINYYRDEVSGLYSASFLRELLNYMTDNSKRYNEPLCLVILSIVNEKSILSSHGRQALQWVIRTVAQVVNQELRNVDLFARWGSGRFLLMLRNTDIENVQWILKRIDNSLHQSESCVAQEIKLQSKWSCLHGGESAESLLQRIEAQDEMLTLG